MFCRLPVENARGIARVNSKKGEVPVETLDSFFSNKKVDLIKIDVEGFEIKVLRGAQDILKRQSPFLFIEAHNKEDKEGVDEILNPLGYKAMRVFNPSATYFYVKDNKYSNTPLDWAFYYLRMNRLLRWT